MRLATKVTCRLVYQSATEFRRFYPTILQTAFNCRFVCLSLLVRQHPYDFVRSSAYMEATAVFAMIRFDVPDPAVSSKSRGPIRCRVCCVFPLRSATVVALHFRCVPVLLLRHDRPQSDTSLFTARRCLSDANESTITEPSSVICATVTHPTPTRTATLKAASTGRLYTVVRQPETMRGPGTILDTSTTNTIRPFLRLRRYEKPSYPTQPKTLLAFRCLPVRIAGSTGIR